MGIGDVYRALWRHKGFILVLTAGLVAAVWFLTSRQQPIYEASTLIRVQQRIEDTGETLGALEASQRLAETYAKIATTDTVADEIFGELNESIPTAEIEGKISADPVRDLDLLSIHVRNPDPKRAQLIANAAPPALEQFIRETGTLNDQVIVVEEARVPSKPASPNLVLNITVAVLLGLVFNGALALMIEALSDRVTDMDELERLTGKPVLTVVPNLDFRREPPQADHERVPRAARTMRRATTSG